MQSATETESKHNDGRSHPGLRVAMAQLAIQDGDLEANMQAAAQAAEEAARAQIDLLTLPEAADWGWLHQEARRDALAIPGKYTDFLGHLARQHRIWISAGCLERDGDKVYNAAVVVNRDAQIVLKHRKIETLAWLTQHLYDCGSPDDIQTVGTEFGRIGLTICADNFDLKHPQRVADLGAWLLVAPHGFAAEQNRLEDNSKEFQLHITNVARKTGLWVIGTDAVLGSVKGGAWKGWLHSGCSVLARPDGTAAAVAKFKAPDILIYDIPPTSIASM